MGDIIDCLNGFHHTSAKSMIVLSFFFFFTLQDFLSIFVFLHNLPYCTHSADLPAVSLTSMMIDYELPPSFIHPAHRLRELFCRARVWKLSLIDVAFDKPFISSNPGCYCY